MFQVRIHGRGGQGVVTAAEMLSVAAFDEGRHAQAFPSFGSERTGAPVVAFCRIAEREIRLREPIMEPDAIIIQDATLLHQVDVFAGLRPDGYILINTNKSFVELGLGELVRNMPPERLCIVPATEIALRLVGRPVPNVPLLAGFAALTGRIRLDSVIKAIEERFSGMVAAGPSQGDHRPPVGGSERSERGGLFSVAAGNVAAAREAYVLVQKEMDEAIHASAGPPQDGTPLRGALAELEGGEQQAGFVTEGNPCGTSVGGQQGA